MFCSKPAAVAALTLIAAAAASNASAQEASRWFVHAGPAHVAPHEKATMKAGGQDVPGANVVIDNRWTVEGEIGYYLTKNIAIAAAGGYPPKFSVVASGSLAGLGTAGKMTGGPAGLLVQYHFNPEGKVQPYVGAGASFLVVFGTDDGVMQSLKAKSAVGTALQVGSDFMISDRWGAFVDVKKAFVDTVATGTLGGAPVRAKVTVDPVVSNVGVTYRF